jgi:hypothetical protein
LPNPTPKRKTPLDLRSLARSYTEHTLQVLHGITLNSQSDSARVAACVVLLDRGWGKAENIHTGVIDGELRIIIRNVFDDPKIKLINGKTNGRDPPAT